MTIQIKTGHCVDVLGEMAPRSVHSITCSPPYYRARRYNCPPQVWPDPDGKEHGPHTHVWGEYLGKGVGRGTDSAKLAIKGTANFQITTDATDAFCLACNAWRGELGWEPTVALYIAHLVQVFRAARRVLRDDGQLWVNIAGGYANEAGGQNGSTGGVSAKAASANRQAGRTDKTGGLPPLNWIDVPGLLGAAMQEPWRACLTCGTEAHTSRWGQIVEPQTGATLFVCPRCRVVRLHRITEKGWIWRSHVHLIKRSPLPESVQGWRWERCRVKVADAPVPHNTETNDRTPHTGHGSVYDLRVPQWADCPGCPKCEKTDGLVLRRGAWRPTRATEALLLFVKGDRYWSDAEAVRVPAAQPIGVPKLTGQLKQEAIQRLTGSTLGTNQGPPSRNAWDWMERSGTAVRLRRDLSPDQRAAAGFFAALTTAVVDADELPPELLDLFEPVDTPATPDHMPWPSREAGFTGAHFAAYPPDLAALCIKAAVPERCCPVCGAGYARVIERKAMVIARSGPAAASGIRLLTSGTMVEPAESVTLSWRPTCSCKAAGPPVSGTVLDPFSGAGSTLLAANRLGRHGIGIDLNESYVDLSETRIDMERAEATGGGMDRSGRVWEVLALPLSLSAGQDPAPHEPQESPA